jgi:HAD superfamily hydrolase (TIGR01490 family)
LPASTLLLDYVHYRLGRRRNDWFKERALAGVVAGAAPEQLEHWTASFVESVIRSDLRVAALAAIERHRAAGHRLILATASFDFYVRQLADRLGFDDVVCTLAERDASGGLTGRIMHRNCYAEEKTRRVAEILAGERNDWEVVAYTDHHSDLPLLEWADVPRVVNPSREMHRISIERGYRVLRW